MAKAPFTISKAPDLSSGAANPAAGFMQAYNWGGVQTDAHVLVGGGAKKTDDENVNQIIGREFSAIHSRDESPFYYCICTTICIAKKCSNY